MSSFCLAPSTNKTLPPLVHWRASAAAPFIPLFTPSVDSEAALDLIPQRPSPKMTSMYLVTLELGAYSDTMGVYSTLKRAQVQAATMRRLYPDTKCSIRVMPLNVIGDVDGQFIDDHDE